MKYHITPFKKIAGDLKEIIAIAAIVLVECVRFSDIIIKINLTKARFEQYKRI